MSKLRPHLCRVGGRKQECYLSVFDQVTHFVHQHSVVLRIIVLSKPVAICCHIVPRLTSQYITDVSFFAVSERTHFQPSEGTVMSCGALLGDKKDTTHVIYDTFLPIAGWTIEWIPFFFRKPWSICTWQWHQLMSPKLHLCGKGGKGWKGVNSWFVEIGSCQT